MKEIHLPNSHLLDSIITHNIGTILSRCLDGNGIIDIVLQNNDFSVDGENYKCSIDGNNLWFCYDLPEDEFKNVSIDLDKAIQYFNCRLSYIYYNENINAQIME